MASTITRATWTDDTGSVSAPNNDGTVINNTRLQADVYDKIDEMFAGAGSYATLTLGGRLAVDGFGDHFFSAGGSGANQLALRNTSAGTGNYARLRIGNNTSISALVLDAFSSTYTSAGAEFADGQQIMGTLSGGLSIGNSHASGVLRFYAGGTTERGRWTADGAFQIREISATPSAPPTSTACNVYMRGDQFVIQFDNAGTTRYYYLNLAGGVATWTHSTTPP